MFQDLISVKATQRTVLNLAQSQAKEQVKQQVKSKLEQIIEQNGKQVRDKLQMQVDQAALITPQQRARLLYRKKRMNHLRKQEHLLPDMKLLKEKTAKSLNYLANEMALSVYNFILGIFAEACVEKTWTYFGYGDPEATIKETVKTRFKALVDPTLTRQNGAIGSYVRGAVDGVACSMVLPCKHLKGQLKKIGLLKFNERPNSFEIFILDHADRAKSFLEDTTVSQIAKTGVHFFVDETVEFAVSLCGLSSGRNRSLELIKSAFKVRVEATLFKNRKKIGMAVRGGVNLTAQAVKNTANFAINLLSRTRLLKDDSSAKLFRTKVDHISSSLNETLNDQNLFEWGQSIANSAVDFGVDLCFLTQMSRLTAAIPRFT